MCFHYSLHYNTQVREISHIQGALITITGEDSYFSKFSRKKSVKNFQKGGVGFRPIPHFLKSVETWGVILFGTLPDIVNTSRSLFEGLNQVWT